MTVSGRRRVFRTPFALALTSLLGACTPREPSSTASDYAVRRQQMVREQLQARDIDDARVLAALEQVPRHEFVPEDQRARAYADEPLPIGRGQTISQPYIVALMTELAAVRGDERVLEVGTGSGYQAAVLSALARQVYSIEIDPVLAESAARRLAALGYRNVSVRAGDGFAGWPEEAPFAAILVTAAAPRVPERLVAQLANGGRIVIPIGADNRQELMIGVKENGQLRLRRAADVRFVPMTGEVRTPRAD